MWNLILIAMKVFTHRDIFFTLIAIFWTSLLWAQDGTFSLVVHNPLYINPAYSTPSNRALSLQTNSRSQWLNLPGPTSRSSGYQFNQISLIAPLKSGRDNGFGGALQLNRSYAGEGRLEITDANVFLGVYQRMARETYIRFGMGVGLRQAHIDWSDLVFSSQLDPYLGLINPMANVNPQNIVTNVAVTPSLGAVLRSHRRINTGALDVQMGYGLFHWSTPNLSFFNQVDPISARHSIHGTLMFFPRGRKGLTSVISPTYFVVNHVFMYQQPHRTNETRLGINLARQLTIYQGFRRKHFVELNGNVDAFITSFQLSQSWGMLSIGYDFTISQLDGCTLGTMEFGYTLPLDSKFIFNSRYNREPCFVEDLLKASEWKAVEKFSKSATSWGFQYSPVQFIP